MQGLFLRLIDSLTQERLTGMFTILAAVASNAVILGFLLQGQENRAIAFTILLFIFVLAFLVVEVAVTALIVAGAGLFVNALYYASPGFGTGVNTVVTGLLLTISWRAIYEYIKLPRDERPPLLNWLTVALLLFWMYYMGIVIYHYVFHYHTPDPLDVRTALGVPQYGVMRFFDGHQVWIGIIPLIVLLRDWRRARRVLIALVVLMAIGLGSIVWEYFSPLPVFYKVLFQLRAAGETVEGYRIRDPAPLYLALTVFFFILYTLGYTRSRWVIVGLIYVALCIFAVLATKNRIVWAGILVVLPLALLLKSPVAILRQAQALGAAALLLGALMLNPTFYDSISRIWIETVERWERNYAFGGDPRLDPSYQFRQKELEIWNEYYKQTTTVQRLFGSGFLQPYGFYMKVVDIDRAYSNLPYTQLYVQKTSLHFSFYARLHRTGLIGVALFYWLLAVFFIYSMVVFVKCRSYMGRAIVLGVVGATVGVLSFDALHGLFGRYEAVPVMLLWSMVPLVAHWQRTGQLPEENTAPAVNPA